MTTPDTPDETIARKQALADVVRRLVESTALADAASTDPADLEAVTADLAAAADRMAAWPSLHATGLAMAPGLQGTLLERSGIAGRSNPLAAPVQWETGPDGVTRGHAVFGPAYEGPPGCVHGGFVAAAFDDLLGSAQTASGSAGYTGTLTVRMIRPTPLGKRIDYEAAVDRVEGRKIHVWGTADCAGERLAEAGIVFIAPADGMYRR